MKSLFEQMGGAYTLQGDYYLPDLILPSEKEERSSLYNEQNVRAFPKN